MLKVKICGITRLEDAYTAVDAGADALGFNFSQKSPRYIAPEHAAAIIGKIPPFVTCTGIFVEHSPTEINAICRASGLQAAQLHSERYTAETVRELRDDLKLIKVFRPEPDFDTLEIRTFSERSGIRCFLFDAFEPEIPGGTGKRIEQRLASRMFSSLRGFGYAILAGGLDADNITEVVRQTRPWAVDTASGTEITPGVKSAEKIRLFVKRAKEA